MNNTPSHTLNDEHIQWLSIMAFMYFQQNQYTKALPLLVFLHENFSFNISVDIQLIQCLKALKHYKQSNIIINKSLNHNISADQKTVLITLQKLNHFMSNNGEPNTSSLSHE